MATALFIKSVDLKRNSIINGSVDPDKLMPHIEISQEIHIQHRIGTDLYTRLQAGVIAGDLTADEIILIDGYIQKALIFHAYAQYLPFARFTISNSGVSIHSSENSSPVDSSDINTLVSHVKSQAEYYTKRLIDYLCEYSSLYPLYDTNSNNDIRPSRRLNYSKGFRSTGEEYKSDDWRIDE